MMCCFFMFKNLLQDDLTWELSVINEAIQAKIEGKILGSHSLLSRVVVPMV